jgi:hypothetical protein
VKSLAYYFTGQPFSLSAFQYFSVSAFAPAGFSFSVFQRFSFCPSRFQLFSI